MNAVVLTHGSVAYRTAGCRCDDCRSAHAIRHFDEQTKLAARLAADPSLAPHGRVSTYSNHGCRCRPCRGAKSEQNRAQYQARRRRAGAT
jgi:hypothetical protein